MSSPGISESWRLATRSPVERRTSYGLVPFSRFQASDVEAQVQAQDGVQLPAHGLARQCPPPQETPFQYHPRPPTNPSPFPEDIDPSIHPPELKSKGEDWVVLFNPSPKVKRVLDVNPVHTLIHDSVVICVKFSPDGKWLATGCNGTAQIFDVKTGVKTCVLDHGRGTADSDMYIRSVCFDSDGKFLITGGDDTEIRIWSISEKRIHRIFKGHQQEIYSLNCSSKGRFIISGSADQTVRIWNRYDGTCKAINTDYGLLRLLNDHGLTSVALSPDEKYIAVGDMDRSVGIWEITTGVLVRRLTGHTDSVYCVTFTPDGKGLMSGSFDATLKYWDVSGLGIGSRTSINTSSVPLPCLMNLSSHKDYVLYIAISHDGAWAVSGSKDRNVMFWDARTGVVQCMLLGHRNSVIQVDLNPVENLLVTGGGDGQVRIWSYGVVG